VQGQEHDAGVQVVAGLEGGCQAHFHRFRQAWIVALGEALRAQHTVAEKLRRGGVRERVGTGLPEQLERGELHRFRHEPRVEAHAAQRLVETLQLMGAAENAEQAEHGKEANTPTPRREGRSCQPGAELLGHAQVRTNARYAHLAAAMARANAGQRIDAQLDEIAELQRMIDTGPAETLEDAAVKLRRLGAYVESGQPARLLAEGADGRGGDGKLGPTVA